MQQKNLLENNNGIWENNILDKSVQNEKDNINKTSDGKSKTEPLNYHEMVELVGLLHYGCKRNSYIGTKISCFLMDMVNILESNVSDCVNYTQNTPSEKILDRLM